MKKLYYILTMTVLGLAVHAQPYQERGQVALAQTLDEQKSEDPNLQPKGSTITITDRTTGKEYHLRIKEEKGQIPGEASRTKVTILTEGGLANDNCKDCSVYVNAKVGEDFNKEDIEKVRDMVARIAKDSQKQEEEVAEIKEELTEKEQANELVSKIKSTSNKKDKEKLQDELEEVLSSIVNDEELLSNYETSLKDALGALEKRERELIAKDAAASFAGIKSAKLIEDLQKGAYAAALDANAAYQSQNQMAYGLAASKFNQELIQLNNELMKAQVEWTKDMKKTLGRSTLSDIDLSVTWTARTQLLQKNMRLLATADLRDTASLQNFNWLDTGIAGHIANGLTPNNNAFDIANFPIRSSTPQAGQFNRRYFPDLSFGNSPFTYGSSFDFNSYVQQAKQTANGNFGNYGLNNNTQLLNTNGNTTGWGLNSANARGTGNRTGAGNSMPSYQQNI